MEYPQQTGQNQNQLTRHLSPVNVWALAFGCAVGWGAFVMPGTTFLPKAGPLGTALGILIGAAVMFIIGVNYHCLLNRYPESGGTLTYTAKTFGYDHGFLSGWFLALVYIAIIWANATALALIGRNLCGNLFQFGFHYQLLGYDVYGGEMLLSVTAIVIFGLICIHANALSVWVQTVMAVLLFGGVVICFIAVMGEHQGGMAAFSPAFAPIDVHPAGQILNIVVLAPWAFVGFESVSHSTEEFTFPAKKTIWLLAAALVTAALAYLFLAVTAAAILPEGYETWSAYIAGLNQLDGLPGLPTFFAANAAMGRPGLILLAVTTLSAIGTGLVGNYIAASRLLYAMARDNILPKWFGKVNKNGSPVNALTFLMLISIIIPFVGRTAIGWIVDVNTIGALIAYAYTSAAAFVTAKRENNRIITFTGIAGLMLSIGFFVYFMSLSGGAVATESYLILAAWSILGFVFFRYIFGKDTTRRFGKSTVVWIGLLFLIFFTSLMWIRQATSDMTTTVVHNISEFYEAHNANNDPQVIAETEYYLTEQLNMTNRLLTRNSIIQMFLISAALAIMFSVYTTMSRREQQMEIEKAQAQESSKAKSIFLSNMSHDIRTPMNAIIGYTTLAKREGVSPEEMRGFLDKIGSSSQHLLALINDVLEMSRIESGKMDLEPVEVDLKKMLSEVRDMFATQMESKQIAFTVDAAQIRNQYVMCDKNRLNRVLLNLLSNAYKFTPDGGSISVTFWQIDDSAEGHAAYELRVKDSGIGMEEEFAKHVFEAFERERTSTVSGIQGTGLGMAITKSIVDLMGGSIEVITAPGEGTEFIVRVRFALAPEREKPADAAEYADESGAGDVDFSKIRLLLVEDNEINQEIAILVLEEAGFTVDTAMNGKEALDTIAASAPGEYDAVLMDIQMPVMDGYEAARAIRKLENPALANIPIIAMSANAFSEDIQAAAQSGMNGHIAKPIEIPKMMETLSEILRQNMRKA